MSTTLREIEALNTLYLKIKNAVFYLFCGGISNMCIIIQSAVLMGR